MSNDADSLEEETGDIKRRYQSISAPRYLAARIRAQVQDHQPTPRRRRFAYAVVPVAIAILATLPFILHQETPATVNPKLPSLTSLARLTPSKPTTMSPSLSRIRTVHAPSMPTRPTEKKTGDTQSYFETEKIHKFEENNHEYV